MMKQTYFHLVEDEILTFRCYFQLSSEDVNTKKLPTHRDGALDGSRGRDNWSTY